MKVKKRVFYFITLLIPPVFFIILEISLRVFNYGTEIQPVFISDPFDANYSILNPRVAERYFPVTEFAPSGQYDLFESEKSDSTFRIFVQGASTSAGFPYHNASSPRLLEQKLSALYPNLNIEVVNTSLVATNSFTLLDLSDDIIKQQPDAVIIYSGHNEFYGALGVASSQSFGKSPLLTNLYLKLKHVKTVQLVKNIIRSFYSNKPEGDRETLMAKMVKEESIPFDSKLHESGVKQYEFNISALLQKYQEAEIPVYISTLVSNLKDFKPFTSSEKGGADSLYSEAEKMLSTNNIERAKGLFQNARDFDLLKFRATSGIENLVPVLAKKYNAELVNMRTAFEAASDQGIVGNDLMNEHVHPNLKGQRIMADELFDAIEALVSKKGKQASRSDFEYSIASVDSLYGHLMVQQLLLDWPFVNASEAQTNQLKQSNESKVLSGQIPWVEVLTKSIYAQLDAEPLKALATAKVLHQELHNQVQPTLLLAQAYSQLGLYNQAESLLKTFSQEASQVEVQKFRLTNLIAASDYQKAIQIANELLELNKNDVQSSRTKDALLSIVKVDLYKASNQDISTKTDDYLDALEGLIFIQKKDIAETLQKRISKAIKGKNDRFLNLTRRMNY
ncbi:hypothetical protein [Roseivirga sp.]|uniref:hypothetical protein n=1 Tax=Roseivirga sp. TaxID=1964215 RepID=UPI003B8DF176